MKHSRTVTCQRGYVDITPDQDSTSFPTKSISRLWQHNRLRRQIQPLLILTKGNPNCLNFTPFQFFYKTCVQFKRFLPIIRDCNKDLFGVQRAGGRAPLPGLRPSSSLVTLAGYWPSPCSKSSMHAIEVSRLKGCLTNNGIVILETLLIKTIFTRNGSPKL